MPQATFKGRYYTYGESGENKYDPIYIKQPDDHSCALRSQQIVLRDFGIDIPFEDLERLAKENGVYTDHGTMQYDVGKVLEICGVGMHQVHGNMKSLINELSQGHRVIVSVDSNELWYNNTPLEKFANWIKDVLGFQGGNHALIVAGVEVNPLNENDVKVILTDPGAGHLRIEYPMKQFADAWRDSGCFMVATDNPAPYQYDAETGKCVPSNFAVEHNYAENQLVLDNGYQLKPDMINTPSGYTPKYDGHLGFDSIDDFLAEWKDDSSLTESDSLFKEEHGFGNGTIQTDCSDVFSGGTTFDSQNILDDSNDVLNDDDSSLTDAGGDSTQIDDSSASDDLMCDC